MNQTTMNYSRPSSLDNFEDAEAFSGIPAWKRVLDVCCILLAAPVLLPVGFLIALIIKVVSPGPVLFKQERVGYRGRRFMCLKFRTMRVNAETEVHQGHLVRLMTSDGPMVKLDVAGDPRLIPSGLVLRSLGLDELPQLLNVLRGEMSWVGPRPCIPYEYEHYQPCYRRRCGTLPGLTGLWQVNGKNRTTFEQMMEFDLHYVEHKSITMDLKIMALTIPAIVMQVRDVRARRKKGNVAVEKSPVSRRACVQGCFEPPA
jgi:lipopolysaccharide/colanic/teichoic acid biosynthesis glycosyltransferase